MLGTKIAGLKAVTKFSNWPTLLVARLFDRHTGLAVYRMNDVEIIVDHRGGDENGTRACIVGDMYRRYLPFLGIHGPLSVLDLGANGGGFPLMLHLARVQLSQVVCVEMIPLTALRLAVNLRTNFGTSAVAINAAVCDRPGVSSIRVHSSFGGTSESIFNSVVSNREAGTDVPVLTLQAVFDAYFKDRIVDICKVDIEGAEYEVLLGADDSLLCRIGHLIIELHDPEKSPALLEKLARLGFEDISLKDAPVAGQKTEVRAFRGPLVRPSA